MTDHHSTSAKTLELITTACLRLKFKNNSNRRSLESSVPQHLLGSPTSGLSCPSICGGGITGLPFLSPSAGLRAISRWARDHCNPQMTLHMPQIKPRTLSPAWSHQTEALAVTSSTHTSHSAGGCAPSKTPGNTLS